MKSANKGSSDDRFFVFHNQRLRQFLSGSFLWTARKQSTLTSWLWNHRPASLLASRLNHLWRNAMNILAISLAAGASALFMTAASAAPISVDASVDPESNIQNVRMVCDEDGRCWRERG